MSSSPPKNPNSPSESPHIVAPRNPDRRDRLVRTISGSGGVAVKALLANGLVAEALSRRPHTATAGDALGRTMMGALLIAVGSAADDADDANVESVQVQVRGDGPLGGVTAIGDSRARVRGTVQRPGTELLLSDGTPDIARAVGQGPLNLVRHRPRWKSPYTGTVPLVSGEIAGDLTLYLTESEQTPSAMGLGVAFGPHMHDVAAAGFLVQAMPDAEDEELARVEANVKNLTGLGVLLERGLEVEALIDALLEGLGSRERHTMHPEFYCPCTRDRALRTLALLSREELVELAEGTQGQEVICDFCGRDYQLESTEIAPLLAEHPQ